MMTVPFAFGYIMFYCFLCCAYMMNLYLDRVSPSSLSLSFILILIVCLFSLFSSVIQCLSFESNSVGRFCTLKLTTRIWVFSHKYCACRCDRVTLWIFPPMDWAYKINFKLLRRKALANSGKNARTQKQNENKSADKIQFEWLPVFLRNAAHFHYSQHLWIEWE